MFFRIRVVVVNVELLLSVFEKLVVIKRSILELAIIDWIKKCYLSIVELR